jgi:hypothetical protein
MFEDKGVVNKMTKAFRELPDEVPALVALGLETRHFLRLDHVKHPEGVERYLEEVNKITGELRRRVA